MFKLILFMIIVFNTVSSTIVHAQDARHEAMKAKMDSIKNVHLEKLAQVKKEIFEKQQTIYERIEKSNAENTIIINEKIYSTKDSIDIKTHSGLEVQVEGEGNTIIIERQGDRNSVIVSQSGKGNTASINNTTQKQPKKENEKKL